MAKPDADRDIKNGEIWVARISDLVAQKQYVEAYFLLFPLFEAELLDYIRATEDHRNLILGASSLDFARYRPRRYWNPGQMIRLLEVFKPPKSLHERIVDFNEKRNSIVHELLNNEPDKLNNRLKAQFNADFDLVLDIIRAGNDVRAQHRDLLKKQLRNMKAKHRRLKRAANK